MRPRFLALVVAPLVLTFTSACSNGDGPIGSTAPLAASDMHAVTATIQPSVVPVTPVSGFGCPLLPPFTTSFNVVLQQPAGVTAVPGKTPFIGTSSSASFVPSTGNNVFVDHVTFHFLDGSNLTSEPITFERGSFTGLGSFRFTPQFGCGIGTPILITADIGLIDAMGGPFTVSTKAAMR